MKKNLGYLLTALVALPVMGFAATISGVVSSAIPGATTTSGVSGAVVTVTSGSGSSATLVGTATTDINGNYAIANVPTGFAAVSIAASGYTPNPKDTGLAVNSTTATVTCNAVLTGSTGANAPGTSTIAGLVTRTNVKVVGAKVVLRRRATATGAWVLVDSTTTDANGTYQFANILAAGTGTPSNAYSLIVSQPGYATLTSTTAITVAAGATTAANVALTTTGIQQLASTRTQSIRLSVMGDRLSLNLSVSNVARTVQIFGFDGSLKRQVYVAAGESRAIVPATFANGYLFQVK